ncbi:hypothetical protein DFI02_110140 [Rhizobium sp. PP-F2F-G20b]|nr:hypothetical protein DFI02_110140 [Rhizobium sp. PP-F2F-G20b]
MQVKFLAIEPCSPIGRESFGTHRELYTALLDQGIKSVQAMLAALGVLTNIQNQSPYTCYADGYTILAEAC